MNNQLKKRIMKRVYIIWFFRKIAPAVFLYMPFLAFVALRETAREFFVIKIIENFLRAVHESGLNGALNFVFSAFNETPVLPTVVIIASLALFVFILRKLFRNFKGIRLVSI